MSRWEEQTGSELSARAVMRNSPETESRLWGRRGLGPDQPLLREIRCVSWWERGARCMGRDITCGCASCKHLCTFIVDIQTSTKWRNRKAQPTHYHHPESRRLEGPPEAGSLSISVEKEHKDGRPPSSLSPSRLLLGPSAPVLTVIWLTSSREILSSLTHSQINTLESYFSQILYFSRDVCAMFHSPFSMLFSPILDLQQKQGTAVAVPHPPPTSKLLFFPWSLKDKRN